MATAETSDSHATRGRDGRAARAAAEALADALARRLAPGLAEALRPPRESSPHPPDAETLGTTERGSERLDPEDDALSDVDGVRAMDDWSAARIPDPRGVLLAASLLAFMPRDPPAIRDPDPPAPDAHRVVSPKAGAPRERGPRERVLLALRVALRARLGTCLEAARAGAFPPLARFLLSAARDAEARPSPATKSVARLARECVARVAAQTCEPADVRSYLAMARGAGGSGAGRGALAEALAEALERTESLGPAATFELDGEGSGLLGATGGGEGAGAHVVAGAGADAGADAATGTAAGAAATTVPGGGAGLLRRIASAVAGATVGQSETNPRASKTPRGAFGRKKEWPFRRGFAVVTWLYVESFRASRAAEDAAAASAAMASASASARWGDAYRASPAAAAAAAAAAGGDAQEHMPRLFSFLSTDPSDANGTAQGVEAYFHGPFLVVEATGADGRRAAMPFTTPFATKTWRCVAVEYEPPAADAASRAARTRDDAALARRAAAPHGEVRLYLDGAVVESHRFEVPPVTGPLGFCCVGTNPPAAMAGMQRRRRQCALFASVGPVYFFREAVGARAAAELAARGGTYVPRYGARGGAPPTSPVDAVHARLDAALAPKLLQVLHPATAAAASGDRGDASGDGPATVCDLSPLGGGGTRSDRRGSLLGRAVATARTPLRDAIGRASPLGAAALLSLMCAEEEEEDAAAAAALVPTLRAVSACLVGDAATAASAVAALEAAAFAPTLRVVLPRALKGLRDATKRDGEAADEALDAEETKAVRALEVLVAERAPRGSELRASLCAAFFASFEAWTGGDAAEVRARKAEPSPGVGVPALLDVLRVTHALAHAEGGAALRAAGGAARLLDAAKNRARFPVCHSSGPVRGGPGGGPEGGGPGGERRGAIPVPTRSMVPSSLRAGVGGAPPPPSLSEHAPFGVRPPNILPTLSTTNTKRRASLPSSFAARGALLDALVAPVSALLRSDANAREALAEVVAFAGDCEDPRAASRALLAALAVAESPGAAGAESRRALARAGGADACAGLLRALALRYEERRGDPRETVGDVVHDRSDDDASASKEKQKRSGDSTPSSPADAEDDDDAETRLGAGELAASCARVLSALARGGELAGPGERAVRKDASFLDAALAERAARHAFRLAPRALLTPEAWSSLIRNATDAATLGAALESVPRASAATRGRALADARALFRSSANPGDAAGVRDAPEIATRLSTLPEWPEWLVECVVREAADAADPRSDETSRAAARESARNGLDALDARWARESARAGGWRHVETALRAFRESAVDAADATRARARRRARAARMCSELALGAHAAYVAAALRRSRETAGEPSSFSGTDARVAPAEMTKTDGTSVRDATRATLLAHARFLSRVVAEALAEDAPAGADPKTERVSSETSISSPERSETSGVETEEEAKETTTTRLGLLRSARALVDALFASTEGSATLPFRRDVAAAALRVALLSLRAATAEEEETAADDSVTPGTTETTKAPTTKAPPSRLAAPLASQACAEAAASADGVGAGGISAADALGYAFLGFAAERRPSGDAAASFPGPEPRSAAERAAELGRCLAATHRVLAPYLQKGRSLRAAIRTRAPHFALAALFSELRRNERRRESRCGGRNPAVYGGVETVSAFLCAHLLCLVGRWRSDVAEACADGEDSAGTCASASAASELLGTAEPTRAMLTSIPAAEAVAAALAPPWSDALESTLAAESNALARLRLSTEPDPSGARAEDDDNAWATEASRSSARADAERAAADARERAFAAFDARWRRLGMETRSGNEESGDEESEDAPSANLSAKTAHVAARWREILERASSARADARHAALESARRRDEAWRAFAERCADAGFGAPRSAPRRRAPSDDVS